MTIQPSLFVSHGGPNMAVQDSPARRFLQTLREHHPPPRAILIVSAHWEAPGLALGAAPELETIHDYYGFPEAYYQFHYPAKGNPECAQGIAARIAAAGLGEAALTARGLDHGAWLPLMLAYPDADVPIVPLSLQAGQGPGWHLELGAALRSLRRDGVLVLCSGAMTHNLREMDRNAPPGAAVPWAADFAAWINRQIQDGDTEALAAYRTRAPHAARNHPSEEHIMPLFVALGAATPGAAGRRLHQSFNNGVLAMDAYAWD